MCECRPSGPRTAGGGRSVGVISSLFISVIITLYYYYYHYFKASNYPRHRDWTFSDHAVLPPPLSFLRTHKTHTHIHKHTHIPPPPPLLSSISRSYLSPISLFPPPVRPPSPSSPSLLSLCKLPCERGYFYFSYQLLIVIPSLALVP